MPKGKIIAAKAGKKPAAKKPVVKKPISVSKKPVAQKSAPAVTPLKLVVSVPPALQKARDGSTKVNMEIKAITKAFSVAKKQSDAAKKAAVKAGTKAAKRSAGKAKKDEVKLSGKLKALKERARKASLTLKLQELSNSVKAIAVDAQESGKAFGESLDKKADADLEKATAAFAAKWKASRVKKDAAKLKKQAKKDSAKVKATSKKIAQKIQSIEKKEEKRVKAALNPKKRKVARKKPVVAVVESSKSPAPKTVAKKPEAKKSVARKLPVKKPAIKKPAMKKAVAKKPAAKKKAS